MHIRLITFRLAGIDAVGYIDLAESVAPQFLQWPGLELKFWLADEATNTYGGVYVFESATDADASRRTDLFAALTHHPALVDVAIREFGVLDTPTAVTTAALTSHRAGRGRSTAGAPQPSTMKGH